MAEVIIKKSDNLQLGFDNILTVNQANNMPNYNNSLACLVFNKPFKTKKNNTIKLNSYGI